MAALGLAVGGLVHVAATVFGLSAIFEHSPTLYTVIKFAGAAYLIYLGIGYWRSKSFGAGISRTKEKPLFSVFKESILIEVTNPKNSLVFSGTTASVCCARVRASTATVIDTRTHRYHLRIALRHAGCYFKQQSSDLAGKI